MRHKNAVAFFMIVTLWSLAAQANAGTITASSCSVIDINNAITAANIGDTVLVPEGNCNWDATPAGGGLVNISKEINLIGAGKGKTNITITNASPNFYNAIQTGANNWRISGFSFTTSASRNRVIATSSYGWRIDNNKFNGFHYPIFSGGKAFSSSVSSVIDHNEFYGGGVQVYWPNVEPAWTEPTDLGSHKFLFIEDNKFSDANSLEAILHVVAMNAQARVVTRYNDIVIEAGSGIGDAIDAHGQSHGDYIRSTRAYEIYGNRFTMTARSYPSSAVYLRGGTGVVHGNSFLSSYGRGGAIALNEIRACEDGYTTGSDGNIGYGWSTTARCTATYYRLKISANPWSIFTWTTYGHGIEITGKRSGARATIMTMGGVYLYFLEEPSAQFEIGEQLQTGCPNACVDRVATAGEYEIQHGEGYPCLDQVGRGQGQSAEPIYIWGNSGNDAVVLFGDGAAGLENYIVEQRDYIRGVMPGYVPYEYPHPLTKTTTLTPPGNLRLPQ
ncbi:MAG: hypothetical protein C4582_11990 [Desulfobacteraceae bacterium]|nr:MAG: hypothetical protein C4582_11990 [Desulfobacteraceae bacterium]